jgi:hypothetical protein
MALQRNKSALQFAVTLGAIAVGKEGRLCAMLRNQTAFISGLSQYYVQRSAAHCLKDFRAEIP